MGEINTSTLKKFLKSTGIRSQPAATEIFGNKICAYAKKLAEQASKKAIAENRKTLFPEDFKMAEETMETPKPEETEETTETAETESKESEDSKGEN